MSEKRIVIEGSFTIKNQKESYEENAPTALKLLQKLVEQSYPHDIDIKFIAIPDDSRVIFEFPMDADKVLQFGEEYVKAQEKDDEKGYWL